MHIMELWTCKIIKKHTSSTRDSIPLPVPLTTHTRTSQTGHPLNHRTIIRIPTKKYISYMSGHT
jgi:hypothetical protein